MLHRGSPLEQKGSIATTHRTEYVHLPAPDPIPLPVLDDLIAELRRMQDELEEFGSVLSDDSSLDDPILE